MEPPQIVSPYDSLLRETSSILFKPPIPQEEGLAILEAYVKADFSWRRSVKPLRETWHYKRSVHRKHTALVGILGELHQRQKNQRVTSLSLEDVVSVAYQQSDPVHQRAVLLLGHEFGFYTITEQANAEYLVDGDTKQSIATLITKMEEAKAADIPSSEVMSYVLPVLFREEPPPRDSDIFDPLYRAGITAILEGNVSALTALIRDNKAKLTATAYKKHVALFLLGAHCQNMRVFPQAVGFYEKSLDATPTEEVQEPPYVHSVTALFELYSMSPHYTTKIVALYHKAKAAGILLDETQIFERVAHSAAKTVLSYSHTSSNADLCRLDPLLSLAEIPLVRPSLVTAYTSMMRQALDNRNIDHAKHCRDQLALLSEEIPFAEELREGIHEKILDAIALEYEFALLQYEVGAVREGALALEKCKRQLQPSTVGAVELLTAKIQYAQGETDAALASLEAAVAADFTDVRYKTERREAAPLLLELGHHYHLEGQTNRAEVAFRLAVTADPLSASTIYTSAQQALTEKDYNAALTAATRAATFASYCPQAPRQDILRLLNSVGVVYKDGKETPKNLALAKHAFTCTLTLDSDSIDAHYHLGTIAMMEKDNALAIEHLRTVIKQKPKHSWGQYQLGLAYQRHGEEERSQQHLHIAAELGHTQAQKLIK